MSRCGLIIVLAFQAFWLLPGPADARSPGRSGLQIIANVSGATVRIDGKLMGTTPLPRVGIAPGTHRVVVHKLGYQTWTRRVKVRRREMVKLKPKLVATAGVLTVRSGVVGAMVWVDGNRVGSAPLRRELEAGSHVVEVRANGHVPLVEKLDALPGAEYVIQADLDAARASDRAFHEHTLAARAAGPATVTVAAKSPTADDEGGAIELPSLDLAPLPISRSDSAKERQRANEKTGKSSNDMPELQLVPPMLPRSQEPAKRPDRERPSRNASSDHELLATATVPVSAPAWYERWWVLSSAGAALIAGVSLTAILMARRDPSSPASRRPDETIVLHFSAKPRGWTATAGP